MLMSWKNSVLLLTQVKMKQMFSKTLTKQTLRDAIYIYFFPFCSIVIVIKYLSLKTYHFNFF